MVWQRKKNIAIYKIGIDLRQFRGIIVVYTDNLKEENEGAKYI